MLCLDRDGIFVRSFKKKTAVVGQDLSFSFAFGWITDHPDRWDPPFLRS